MLGKVAGVDDRGAPPSSIHDATAMQQDQRTAPLLANACAAASD